MKSSPLPQVYVIYYQWYTIPLCLVIGYGIIGVEEAAAEVEQPFGRDFNGARRGRRASASPVLACCACGEPGPLGRRAPPLHPAAASLLAIIGQRSPDVEQGRATYALTAQAGRQMLFWWRRCLSLKHPPLGRAACRPYICRLTTPSAWLSRRRPRLDALHVPQLSASRSLNPNIPWAAPSLAHFCHCYHSLITWTSIRALNTFVQIFHPHLVTFPV
jgi:hypothetical protein